MRQRVMIAMALTTRPEVLIADEPTTALDVTVQAQILMLLKQIQKDTGMAIILITHDLGVIADIADRVVVMYAGKVFEEGSSEDIFYRSEHPYTYALLKSTPRIDQTQETLPVIGGMPPDLSRLAQGCPFYERCEYRMNVCLNTFPAARHFDSAHRSFCHLEEIPK
jgi:oligopeptide/dipeptide ABC transporter ATP-binding protein